MTVVNSIHKTCKDRKRVNQYWHSRQRAQERFGLEFYRADMNTVIDHIQEKRALFVHRVSNRISVHALIYKDKKIVVFYDHKRHSLATIMDEEMFLGMFPEYRGKIFFVRPQKSAVTQRDSGALIQQKKR